MYIGPWQEYQLAKLLHREKQSIARHTTLAKAGLTLIEPAGHKGSGVGSEPSEKSFYSAPVFGASKILRKQLPQSNAKRNDKLDARSHRIPERIKKMRELYGLETKQVIPMEEAPLMATPSQSSSAQANGRASSSCDVYGASKNDKLRSTTTLSQRFQEEDDVLYPPAGTVPNSPRTLYARSSLPITRNTQHSIHFAGRRSTFSESAREADSHALRMTIGGLERDEEKINSQSPKRQRHASTRSSLVSPTFNPNVTSGDGTGMEELRVGDAPHPKAVSSTCQSPQRRQSLTRMFADMGDNRMSTFTSGGISSPANNRSVANTPQWSPLRRSSQGGASCFSPNKSLAGEDLIAWSRNLKFEDLEIVGM